MIQNKTKLAFFFSLLLVFFYQGCGQGFNSQDDTVIDIESQNDLSAEGAFFEKADFYETGANYSLNGSQGLFQFDETSIPMIIRHNGNASHIHTHYFQGENYSNYTVSGYMKVEERASQMGVTFYSQYPRQDTYYALTQLGNSDSFHLIKREGGVSSVCEGGSADTGIIPELNEWYAFKIQVQSETTGTLIQAKIWPAIAQEPLGVQAECTDSSVSRLVQGTVGLYANGSGEKEWASLSLGLNPFGNAPQSPNVDVEVVVAQALASSEDQNNVASNTIDKDINTRWSAQGVGETLDLIFDGHYVISRVEIVYASGFDQTESYFDLQLQQGTQLNTILQNQTASHAAGFVNNYAVNSSGLAASSLRLIGKGNDRPHNWNSISEISIYGIKVNSNNPILAPQGTENSSSGGSNNTGNNNGNTTVDTNTGGSNTTDNTNVENGSTNNGGAMNPPPQTPEAPPVDGRTACNDGIDNDGDGLVDWGFDLGCHSAADNSERAQPRGQENGYTTFDLPTGARIIYVSSQSGNDNNDGLSPERAVRSLNHGASMIRGGRGDFLLLKRGESFYGRLAGLSSGAGPNQRTVIGSYGNSTARPVIYYNGSFINIGGRKLENVAIVGLEIKSPTKDPTHPNFTGEGGDDVIRLISPQDYSTNILLEDNKIMYGQLVFTGFRNLEIRKNSISYAYRERSCTADMRGEKSRRISGLYLSNGENLLFEENLLDHNGWSRNPKMDRACATIYSHNSYFNAINGLKVLNNMVSRASSLGLKFRSDGTARLRNIEIKGNIITEGEVGISIGGENRFGANRFSEVEISNNIIIDIGESNPTGRGIANAFTMEDHRNSRVTSNLIIKGSRGRALALRGSAMNNVTISGNEFYGYTSGQVIDVGSSVRQSNVSIQDNPSRGIPNNQRDLPSYAASIGLNGNLDALTDQIRAQSRYHHSQELQVQSIHQYLKGGY
jgi:hypothetical protein